ncbi:MAG: sulfur carrier protein ThiS [Gallionellaceae bacterium]|jgi:sulfur carrier protein
MCGYFTRQNKKVITVFINGSARTFDHAITIASLISLMELTGKRIAIECNTEIVPRGKFPTHLLVDGDKIEIVVAVGGG